MFLVKLRFFLRAAQCQQREDVGFTQRRLRAIGRLQIGRCAVQSDSHVVVLHSCSRVDVDGGINPDGIRKVDIAALQLVLRAGEGSAAICDLNAAQDRWFADGPPHGKVHPSGEFGVAVLKVKLRRTADSNVQSDIVRRRGGIRRGLHAACSSKGCEVYIRAHAKAREKNGSA